MSKRSATQKCKHRPWLILTAVFLLAAAGSIGAWFYFAPNDLELKPLNPDADPESTQRGQIAAEWANIRNTLTPDVDPSTRGAPGLAGDGQAKIFQIEQVPLTDAEADAFHGYVSERAELLDIVVEQIRMGGPLRPDSESVRTANVEFYAFYLRARGPSIILLDAAIAGILHPEAASRDPMDYIFLALDYADLVGAERLIQSYELKCSIYRQTSYVLRAYLAANVMSELDCEELRARMGANRDTAPFRAALENDFVLAQLEIASVNESNAPMWWVRGPTGEIQKSAMKSPIGGVLASVDVALHNSRLGDIVTLLEGSYADNAESYKAISDSVRNQTSLTGYSNVMLRIHLNNLISHWRHHTLTYMVDIATYAEAYERAHGRYPESLEALTEFSGVDLPTDPFTNEPFIFESTQDGYALQSDGAGLSPDGATPNPTMIWKVNSRH